MSKPLNEIDVMTTATAAGLRKAVERFPTDVLAAARASAQVRSAFSPPDDPTTEPSPAMRTGGCV